MQVQIVTFFFLTSSVSDQWWSWSWKCRLLCVARESVFWEALENKTNVHQPCNCSSCTSRYLTHAYKGDRQKNVTMSIKATQKQPKYHNDSLCSLYYRNTTHLQKFSKFPQLWWKSKLKLFKKKKPEFCISQAVSDSLTLFPPACWNYMCMPSYLVYEVLRIDSRTFMHVRKVLPVQPHLSPQISFKSH